MIVGADMFMDWKSFLSLSPSSAEAQDRILYIVVTAVGCSSSRRKQSSKISTQEVTLYTSLSVSILTAIFQVGLG